jgi:hypothetical protein
MTDMKAMIKKAIPAHVRLPVRSQTTTAMMAAGRKKSRTLAITMIMMRPITTKRSKATISSSGGKLGTGIKGAITGPSVRLRF